MKIDYSSDIMLTLYFFASVAVFIGIIYIWNKWEAKKATSYYKKRIKK